VKTPDRRSKDAKLSIYKSQISNFTFFVLLLRLSGVFHLTKLWLSGENT